MNDIRARLRGEMDRQPLPDDALERLRTRRDVHLRRRRVITTVAASITTIGILGGSLSLLIGLSPTRDPRAAAPAGAPRRDLALQPGEYFFERRSFTCESRTTDGLTRPDDAAGSWETWWGADGSAQIRRLADHPSYGEPRAGTFGPGELVESRWWEDVSSLSTDPDVLYDQLLERSTPGGASPQPAVTMSPGQDVGAGAVWRAVMALLEFPNTPPDLRAALATVAAGLPGVRRTDGVTDPGGRRAMSLSLRSDGGEETLFFDEDTLQVMSARTRFPAGEHAFILVAGMVDRLGAVPADEEYLYPPPTTGLPPDLRG